MKTEIKVFLTLVSLVLCIRITMLACDMLNKPSDLLFFVGMFGLFVVIWCVIEMIKFWIRFFTKASPKVLQNEQTSLQHNPGCATECCCQDPCDCGADQQKEKTT